VNTEKQEEHVKLEVETAVLEKGHQGLSATIRNEE
jgi:hypothetical protein